jgi:hypothetical protein
MDVNCALVCQARRFMDKGIMVYLIEHEICHVGSRDVCSRADVEMFMRHSSNECSPTRAPLLWRDRGQESAVGLSRGSGHATGHRAGFEVHHDVHDPDDDRVDADQPDHGEQPGGRSGGDQHAEDN